MDVAILSVVSNIFHLLFYRAWGFVVDSVGRRATILSCIPLIATIPLVYILAKNVIFLYFLIIFGAIGWAGFNIAAFAYFSDVAEKRNVFQLAGFYNSSVEVGIVTGNLLGGILAQHFGLFTVFILSFILRLLALIPFIG